MGVVLALSFYIVMALFLCNFALKALTFVKRRPVDTAVPIARPTPKSAALTVLDIVFLARLFRVNPGLWIGEWIFHMSFVLVMIRHLSLFLDPVPQWVWDMQTIGEIAGYLLPLSLVYIFIMKLAIEKKKYVSSHNFLLLTLLLLMGVSGQMMKAFFPADVMGAKDFMVGLLKFHPVEAQTSPLFIFHFITFLAILALLPTHIFAAPLVLLEARRREEGLKEVVHER